MVSVTPLYSVDGKTPFLFVYIYANMSRAEASKQSIQRFFTLGALAAVALTSLVIILLFRSVIGNRLANLVAVLGRIEQGDLGARASRAPLHDEIGTVQRGVYSMAFQLAEKIDILHHNVDQLEALNTQLNDEIGERKRAEELLEAFFSQSMAGCFFMMLDEPVRWDETVDKQQVLDYVFAHQRVTRINDAMLAQYGDPRAQFIGLTPADFFAHDLAHGRDLWTKFFDQGRTLIESDERKADGTPMWIEGEYVCLYDDQGRIKGHFGIQRDVTMRKQAQAEREEFIEELEARNAEMERFTYTVSHDLKTPLVTIKGFLGLLRQDMARNDVARVETDLAQISQATDTMAQLLSELLELSRIGRQMNPSEAVSLTELAREAVTLVDGAISARGVEVEVAPEMPEVWGDRLRLLEVYQNLIENAVKFMGDQTEPRIEIGARQQGSEVVCYVKDNGIGIDPKYHENVFGLFNRLDQRIEGTGIGLALVRRIVEVHGGRVAVESAGEGQGSTFSFTLPNNSSPNNP